MLEKLKHFVFPPNPVDGRTLARVKRGMIHYAHTGGWSAIPPMQRWIRRHSFQFQHGENGSSTRLKVSAEDLTHLWVADEVLAENVYQLHHVPFTPELIIDLGANIGLFTLLAHRRWPAAQHVCVEPHPKTFAHLSENLALNGIHASKLQCAVTGSGAAMRFLCNEGAVYQALSDVPSGTLAFTIPLRALLPTTPGLKLLIKMDIEGAEEAALAEVGEELPHHCFIFLELHRGDEARAWVDGWAAAHGFKFTEVRRREDAIDGYLARPGTESKP